MTPRSSCLIPILLAALPAPGLGASRTPADRPNILWVTCEDISPNLGSFGDAYAVTPNLDRLASQGVRYTHAFATIGVCAPARSTIITGMYPPSIGSQHMRCRGTLPEGVRMFPEYLRDAGYYCTNNSKTDYNLPTPEGTWDESSDTATYRDRAEGQPFFAVFNFTTSHESQIRLPEDQYRERVAGFSPGMFHDPARATVPPYHPDTPAVRRDWARYADMITYMDGQVGALLDQLEADGLLDDTIVFYYSDHGAGMPRGKRWLYDSSTRVPFIVRFPEKYARLSPGSPGETTDRLISFVDLAPTVLSLAGLEIPGHMQGSAFLGDSQAGPRDLVFGFRDRMDERYDLIRMVRDKRYTYIRNYLPHLPYFHHQHISYMYEMPTMRDWQRLADSGELTGGAAAFMTLSKPVEELYDTRLDPSEVENLASSPEHREILERLRAEHRRWQLEVVDLGLLPESDLRTRFGERAPYDAVRADPSCYPIGRIAEAADLAGRGDPSDVDDLALLLDDPDPAVRWWGATGLAIRGDSALPVADRLASSLEDPAPWVRVAAADALARLGRVDEAMPALVDAMGSDNEWVRLRAINVLDRLDGLASPAEEVIRGALDDPNNYVVRAAEHAVEGIGAGPGDGE
ncbi:sulfatase-like hydrolase/transferase [Tautonia plasticadhaerens]|uniref:Arylsulfatase n=1 Tax=Tautonia plasticadhaerens TaxID=2527974 RepID=A0A518H2I1_9BACT|nr:sulfatase-like hydrolase/transferase [Tautonia plasticadhaerens]QDV35023.1 Arylsulfatase [Tautonia plasticadhaerens]